MKALLINCTLKAGPERSNTEALANNEDGAHHVISEVSGAFAQALDARPIPPPSE